MARELEADVEIGDFRIEKRLGAGGMGIVYLARQLSLNRLVALKVLGSALTRENDIARFKREAQAAARLKHPRIASVYFVGQDNDLCYMAMEFVDGMTLRQVIDTLASSRSVGLGIGALVKAPERPRHATPIRFDAEETVDDPRAAQAGRECRQLPTAEAEQIIASKAYMSRCCELVRDAAAALDYAHKNGVIHRDIKPENLMVDRNGGVHVIDFGIARFFEDATVTQTGQLVGTPLYMSPEQVTARIKMDHRTDLYSLGLVLYELLTLQPPITAPTREELLRRIVTKSLPPITWINQAVPPSLEAVVHKAAAKDPDERYQSGEDYAQDLRRFLHDERVLASPYHYRFDESEIAATRPPWVANIAVAHMLVAAFLAALVGAIVISFGFFAIRGEFYLSGEIYNVFPLVLLLILTPVLVAFGLAAGAYYGVGNGMLRGRMWALVLSFATVGLPAVGSLGCLSWVVVLMVQAFLYPPTNETAIVGWPTLFSLAFLLFVTIVTCTATFQLVRRNTRDWFSLAERLRSEHRNKGEGRRA